MRIAVISLVSLVFAGPALAQSYNYGAGSNSQSHSTSGYVNRHGTYVPPHYQTNPNGTTSDNFDTRGNYNPYTGAFGRR